MHKGFGEVAQREAIIPGELSRVDRNQAELNELVNEVGRRLHSVLRPQGPCPTEDRNMKTGMVMPPLGDHLAAIAGAQGETMDTLRELLDRLEI